MDDNVIPFPADRTEAPPYGWQEWLWDYDDEGIMLMTGMDGALIGVAERCGQKPLAVYDWNLLVQEVMAMSECSLEEAEEHISFNMAGAWVGDQTPLIMQRPDWVKIHSDPPPPARDTEADIFPF